MLPTTANGHGDIALPRRTRLNATVFLGFSHRCLFEICGRLSDEADALISDSNRTKKLAHFSGDFHRKIRPSSLTGTDVNRLRPRELCSKTPRREAPNAPVRSTNCSRASSPRAPICARHRRIGATGKARTTLVTSPLLFHNCPKYTIDAK